MSTILNMFGVLLLSRDHSELFLVPISFKQNDATFYGIREAGISQTISLLGTLLPCQELFRFSK